MKRLLESSSSARQRLGLKKWFTEFQIRLKVENQAFSSQGEIELSFGIEIDSAPIASINYMKLTLFCGGKDSQGQGYFQ